MIALMHNMELMNANRQLGINRDKREKSTKKLSSGYKINQAADNAAGLEISERMRIQIRGLMRGVSNVQDGMSVCQVADGALDEVGNMLHRMKELSVQAANDTNTNQDRENIQKEIAQIVQEIDRIGDTTTFNEIPLFKGGESAVYNADGSQLQYSNISINDFVLADLNLGRIPFRETDNGNQLGLQAIVSNPNSAAYNKVFNLIYKNGSTSASSFRLEYEENGTHNRKEVNLADMQISDYTVGIGAGNRPYWQRTFSYNMGGIDFQVIQCIELSDDRTYQLNYTCLNNSAFEMNVTSMIHLDTAYNNNDRCEGYFNNGIRIDSNVIYNPTNAGLMDGITSPNIINQSLDSISIVDTENALSFAEKISDIDNMMVSIGHYSSIKKWSYYESASPELGQTTLREDLGISLLSKNTISSGDSSTSSFKYGIVALESDPNLSQVDISSDDRPVTHHSEKKEFWI